MHSILDVVFCDEGKEGARREVRGEEHCFTLCVQACIIWCHKVEQDETLICILLFICRNVIR
jgi:hypothetical protein